MARRIHNHNNSCAVLCGTVTVTVTVMPLYVRVPYNGCSQLAVAQAGHRRRRRPPFPTACMYSTVMRSVRLRNRNARASIETCERTSARAREPTSCEGPNPCTAHTLSSGPIHGHHNNRHRISIALSSVLLGRRGMKGADGAVLEDVNIGSRLR